MPDTFTLVADVTCPNCRCMLQHSSRFQWGCLPGSSYKIGEPVRWLRDNDDVALPSFTLYQVANTDTKWNCGDPFAKRAVLLDADIYFQGGEVPCGNCGVRIVAIAGHIGGNVIEAVEAITQEKLVGFFGKSVGRADIATAGDDGKLVPREDWYDHVIKYCPDRLECRVS